MSQTTESFNHRILTAEEETQLGNILINFKPHDKEYEYARTTLLECNLRLVAKAANDFSRMTGLELEDLVNEGYIGLISAIDKYDPAKYPDSRFATYALHWIKQKMRLFANKNLIAHVPIAVISKMVKYKKIINEQPEGELSQEDIASKMDVDIKTLEIVKNIKIRSVSLSSSVDAESTGRETALEETLQDFNAPNSYECAEYNDKISIVKDALNTLSEMDRDIVMSQCGSDKICLKDIGFKYGLSAERIRQIKEQTLSTLKFKLIREKRLMYA